MNWTPALAAAALATSALAQPPRNTISYVNTSGALEPYRLSPGGVVAGSLNDGPNVDSCLWQQGSLFSFAAPSQANSWSYGINDSGTVVGDLEDDGPLPFVADRAGGLRAIDPLGHRFGIAHSINNAGTVVGSASIGDRTGPYRPFLWQNGVGSQLALPAGATEGGAFDITPAGQIAGAVLWGQAQRPVYWDGAGVHELTLPLGFAAGGAHRMTDTGWVAGTAWTTIPNEASAALWHDGAPVVLPGLGGPLSYIEGVSPTGVCVGYSQTPDFNGHAALWLDGQVYNLNDLVNGVSSINLYYARGIDNDGRILIKGMVDGVYNLTAFLVPVPAPSGLSLALAGVVWSSRRTRRREH